MVHALSKIALALILIAASFGHLLSSSKENIAFAVEDPLKVVWESDPLFSLTNLAPGDTVAKKLRITNSSSTTRYAVHLGAIGKTLKKGFDNGELPDKLLISIRDDEGNVLLSPTGLADLLKKSSESGCADASQIDVECSLALSLVVEPTQTITVFADIYFDESATNEYQGAQVGFDVAAGFNEAGSVAGAETVSGEVLGVRTGASLIPSILGSLATLYTGLWLRRRSSSNEFKVE